MNTLTSIASPVLTSTEINSGTGSKVSARSCGVSLSARLTVRKVRLLEGKRDWRANWTPEMRELASMKERFRKWAAIYWPEALR